MMLGVAFPLGVLLALAGGTAGHECTAPRHLVSELLNRLEESIQLDEKPNPSILLAMNLAGDTNSDSNQVLLKHIQEEAVNKAQKDMTSGEVALYLLSLLSSCQNPRQVQSHGHSVDLVSILQKKTDEEVTSLEVDDVPKTSLYGVSLDILGLCLARAGGYQEASVILAKKMLSPKEHHSVDTAAVAALALTCAYDHTDLRDLQDLLSEALLLVTTRFLNEQETNHGMIGNIYSMGLAMQALEATSRFYAPRQWDCDQAFSVVYKHDYTLPMGIAQVLPALVGRSYLDAAQLDCASATVSPSPRLSLPPKVATAGVQRASIEVHYSIINKLQGKPFNIAIAVHVPAGSTLLKVLQEAEKKEPKNFSFKTEQTSWGLMVVSIHGLAANTNDRTYWQFFSRKQPLQEGVGTYKPRDEEHIEAIFSTY